MIGLARILIMILLATQSIEPSTQPSAQPAAQPATQPATRPAKQLAQFPLPPDNELTKWVGPIARDYDVSIPAKTFPELRAVRYTPDGAMHKDAVDPSRDEEFSVLVPSSYQKEKPDGLFVWIAPENGLEYRNDWIDVLDKHELIFYAPHDVPNESNVTWRIFMALEAVKHAKATYNIDADRVYISGISGGGRVSSHAAVFFPEIFDGALAMVGSNFYKNTPAEEKNHIYPGFWPSPNIKAIERGRASTRLVLLTGSKDFNQPSTKAAYQAYLDDNWKFVTYLEVPDMPHTRPNAQWFEKGIVALDAPLFDQAQEKYNQALTLEQKHKAGEACALFESAALHGADQSFVADAAHRAALIRQKLADQLAGARNLAENHKYDQAMQQARKARVDFSPIANTQVDDLLAQITAMKKAGR